MLSLKHIKLRNILQNKNQNNLFFISSLKQIRSQSTKPFNKVLIANRGEIAVRIIKTCKRMGIKTVAVYSDPDITSKHVHMADEAIHIGPASSLKSYLNIDKIMNAIKQTGAEAVHPGYGFLSENMHFARKLEENNVAFVGPPGNAIEAMGDKIQSKQIAIDAGVHTIPGYQGVIKGGTEEAIKIANDIGYPVMIKASAGGGGKGMRIAHNDKEVKEGYKLAVEEAKASFDDDRMFIEKFIEDPHHIEIQLLADKDGNVCTFPERECSIQRRNQKVVEESPSCLLDEKTRKEMGAQAAMLAKAVGYHSAGTVEMLCDENLNFYFLEMNTRLQVEHPITENVTGVDLVEHMLWIASGKPLPKHMQNVQLPYNGHSIESRVYAEDPMRGFLPATGPLIHYKEPTGPLVGKDNSIPSVRVDSGIYEGGTISMFYDPIISKLVSYGETRDEAIHVMRKAIDEYNIEGLGGNNLCFLREIMRNPHFIEGKTRTSFIEDYYPDGFKGVELTNLEFNELAVSTVMMKIFEDYYQYTLEGQSPHFQAPENKDFFVIMNDNRDEPYHVIINEETISENFTMKIISPNKDEMNIELNDIEWSPGDKIFRAKLNDELIILQNLDSTSVLGFKTFFKGAYVNVDILTKDEFDLFHHMLPPVVHDFSNFLVCPMPGQVISVDVREGDHVEAGQELCIVEAMKMQNILRADRAGIVKNINIKAGDTTKTDQHLIEFESEE